MSRLSRRWWTSIAVNCVVLALFPVVVFSADPAEVAAGQATGQVAARSVKERFGSKSGLREAAINPLISSDSSLETVDGSRSFSAQLAFPSSKKFLEVFIQPGATGDLSTVILGEDINFDGSTDYSYRVPVPVSGVCANGIISCTPGTWDDCLHYRWVAGNSGKVAIQETSPDQLGGCYCINSNCGNNLVWNNPQIILRDLGGGAVGAAQQANSSFTISDIRLNDMTIAYYGQDTSRITSASGANNSGSPVATTFLTHPMAMQANVQNEVQSQAGDMSSLYSLVSGLDPQRQQSSCGIDRQIVLTKPSINDVIVPLGGTGAVQFCGPDCINVILGRIGNNYWSGHCDIFERYFRVFVKQPELIQSATIVHAKWDDYMQVWIDNYKVWSGPNNNFPPETAGRCELSTSWNRNPNVNVTSYFKRYGEINTKIRVSVSGEGEGYAFIHIRLKEDRCVVASSIINGCASLEGRTDCELQDEKVDGVQTFHNANPTSLTPLPSTRTLTQGNCTEAVTQDWWHKDRVYLCSNPSYDFTNAADRYGTVVDSISAGSSTYEDQVLREDGSWSHLNGSITLPDVGDFDECELACKTRRSREDSQATLYGTSNDYHTSTSSYDILYHSCVDGICPLEAGEEVLMDCQCLNEFAEAATVIQMLRQAGQDMICSDGVKK